MTSAGNCPPRCRPRGWNNQTAPPAMTFTTVLPLLGVAGFVVAALVLARRTQPAGGKTWLVPAALSLVYLLFSLVAVVTEGPLGFWPNHSQSLWGNQVWLDLLLAVGVAWAFVVPEAKTLGMRPLPWLVGILFSGSIGLLAMVARLLYLREAVPVTAAPPRGVRPASALS